MGGREEGTHKKGRVGENKDTYIHTFIYPIWYAINDSILGSTGGDWNGNRINRDNIQDIHIVVNHICLGGE